MNVGLAAVTVVYCVFIFWCGYSAGRIHARHLDRRRRGGWMSVRLAPAQLSRVDEWTFPKPPVDPIAELTAVSTRLVQKSMDDKP